MTVRKIAAILLLTALAAGLAATATSPAAVTCAGEVATIEGSNGPDTLIGTPSNDVILGYGGNDQIVGAGGGDRICAGAGDDVVLADDGSDLLFGEDGDDIMVGAAGNDVIDGGAGYDTVTYQFAPAGVGASLVGGTGSGGEGEDELRGLEALFGSAYDDTLVGSSGDDTLLGVGGDDQLYGRDGSDVIAGGGGEDLLVGGAGVADVALFTFEQSPVVADLENERATVASETDRLLGMEGLLGSPYDDVLRGDSAENVIAGGDGDDVMDGRGARDQVVYAVPRPDPTDPSQLVESGPVRVDLQAGTGSDRSDNSEVEGDKLLSFETVDGSDRDDVLIGSNRDDSLLGLGGDDVLNARGGDDGLEGGTGSDRLLGGGGVDTALWLLNPAPLELDLSKDRAKSGHDRDRISSIENAVGTPHNDVMRGDGSVNLLVGMAGKDAIHGGGGNDGLRGRGFAAAAEFGLGLGPKKDKILDGGTGRDGCEGRPLKSCEGKRLSVAHAEFLDRFLELVQDIKRRHGVRLRG